MVKNVESFANLSTPAEFVAHAGGDIRLAEAAAWQLWEKQGKPHRDGFALMAVAIAELKSPGRK